MSATLDDLTRRARERRQLPPPAERRAIRDAAGCSLDELADVLNVTREGVRLWETGQREPRRTNLTSYLEALRALKSAVDEGAA